MDTLEYLQKGGRIGKVTAMAGTMLQIKPLITFAADGQLQSIAKVRGRNLVIRKLIELVTQSPTTARRGTIWRWPTAALRRRWRFCRASSPPPCQTYDHIWSGELDGTLSVYIGDGVLGAAVQRLE